MILRHKHDVYISTQLQMSRKLKLKMLDGVFFSPWTSLQVRKSNNNNITPKCTSCIPWATPSSTLSNVLLHDAKMAPQFPTAVRRSTCVFCRSEPVPRASTWSGVPRRSLKKKVKMDRRHGKYVSTCIAARVTALCPQPPLLPPGAFTRAFHSYASVLVVAVVACQPSFYTF